MSSCQSLGLRTTQKNNSHKKWSHLDQDYETLTSKPDSNYHFALARTFCDFQTLVETLAISFDISSYSQRPSLITIKNELDTEIFWHWSGSVCRIDSDDVIR